jgi:hypothetical protein
MKRADVRSLASRLGSCEPVAMGRRSGEGIGELLVRSMMALHLLQVQLAEFMGVSDRTMRRWVSRGIRLSWPQLFKLTEAVHAQDPALAARIAAHHGCTLEDLGLGPGPDQRHGYAMLTAACAVSQASPLVMRPAIAAALEQARVAGLTLEAAHALFAPRAPKRTARAGSH